MSRNMEAALVLTARDEASRPLARSLHDLTRLASEAGKVMGTSGQTGSRAMQQLGAESKITGQAVSGIARQAGAAGHAVTNATVAGSRGMTQVADYTRSAERAVIGLTRESQRMASARQQLGIRAEQLIQREIRQTEAAYQRLARSGRLSASEQARAYQAMRSQVAALKREMQGVVEQQSKLGAAGRGLVAAGTGTAAAAYVLNRPLSSIADYDLRLRNMANTAYADQGLTGRQAGLREMREVIRHSGGNRDAAAEALDNMIASGSLGEGKAGRQAAFDMLPVVMKYATAGDANPNELVDIALKARKTFDIRNPAKALEMALQGGQLGGFEMKNMAKWLPAQMAAASLAGMKGEAGLAKLVALNQSAVTTAGSKDEAGNNVVNFLAKLNASETAGDFKKVGINWHQRLIDGAKAGRDAVDVFGDTIDGLLQKNAAYKKLQGELASAPPEARKAKLDQMSAILQGAVVGKISADRQELMAVLAYLNNRQEQAANERKILAAKPGEAADINLALIKESEAWKSQQFDNTVAEKQFDAMKGLSETVGDTKLKLVDYAAQYPGLSTALVGATTALTALAAAAGAASLSSMLTGAGRASVLSGVGGKAAGALRGPATGMLARAGVAGGLSWLALQGAKAAGLPDVNRAQGQKDLKNGDLLGASLHLPAGEFLSAWWRNEHKTAAPPARPASPFAPPASSPYPARNAPASLPVPQLSVLQSAVSASARMDAAALKFQQAASQPQPVHVTVDVKNGNIVAAVNAANSFTARRN